MKYLQLWMNHHSRTSESSVEIFRWPLQMFNSLVPKEYRNSIHVTFTLRSIKIELNCAKGKPQCTLRWLRCTFAHSWAQWSLISIYTFDFFFYKSTRSQWWLSRVAKECACVVIELWYVITRKWLWPFVVLVLWHAATWTTKISEQYAKIRHATESKRL